MNNKIMQDKLYSLQEVAKHLRVSERTIFRYIYSGKLRATKIGYWRILNSDLEKFLLQNFNVIKTVLRREAQTSTRKRSIKKLKVGRNGRKI